MSNIAKALILFVGMSGCTSGHKETKSSQDSSSFETKIISFYRGIKSSDYRKSLYLRGNQAEKHLNLIKLYSRYELNPELFRRYVNSLVPDISYEDYTDQLRLKIIRLSKDLKNRKYLPAKISSRAKVRDLVSKADDSDFFFSKAIMRRFYSMIKFDDQLTEMKIEFQEELPEKDKHAKKIIVYLYKAKNGNEFIIDPETLVSTNF